MRHDLGKRNWTLAGYSPISWKMGRVMEQTIPTIPEIAPIPASVPGSVHGALLRAGIIPDWNIKLNSYKSEWVDHRDWIYSMHMSRRELAGDRLVLRCLGLDGYGIVIFNHVQVGSFNNGYIPHAFDLSKVELAEENLLEIVFADLPRFNGTPNLSSQIRERKARFNYSWDWMPRNVQIGIWDNIYLDIDEESSLDRLKITTEYRLDSCRGVIRLQGDYEQATSVKIEFDGHDSGHFSSQELKSGIVISLEQVEPWQCNRQGRARLYPLRIVLLGENKKTLDIRDERIGFKHVEWKKCDRSPEQADPWLCALNGNLVFLVGVNWTPIRAHYADVSEAEYRQRLQMYKDIGFNVMRVWGGSFLEKECFYRLCDEMGFLVWQEFPLSSSGPDNEPPTDEKTIQAWSDIAVSYIQRRGHHVSLFIWCGGNELQTAPDGSPGAGLPLTGSHPMLAQLARVCKDEDPVRRFLPTSSSGPTFVADPKLFGQGMHWDVHGPWRIESEDYWKHDDALFRSEAGAPGASDRAIIEHYYPDCELLPVSIDNPYWRRFFWWVDEATYIEENGHAPESIEAYIHWSQQHQARALTRALTTCLNRFPAIGGIIFWMGHDSYPCLANTSILDFHGNIKPAGQALKAILLSESTAGVSPVKPD